MGARAEDGAKVRRSPEPLTYDSFTADKRCSKLYVMSHGVVSVVSRHKYYYKRPQVVCVFGVLLSRGRLDSLRILVSRQPPAYTRPPAYCGDVV